MMIQEAVTTADLHMIFVLCFGHILITLSQIIIYADDQEHIKVDTNERTNERTDEQCEIRTRTIITKRERESEREIARRMVELQDGNGSDR